MATLVFNDTATKQGLIQGCEANCSMSDAYISGNTTLLQEFTRHINDVNSEIWATIFHAYGGAQYDDANRTDVPYASGTLNANQRSYAVPTGTQSLRSVSVLVNSTYTPLAPITFEQIRERGFTVDSFMSTASTPQYYMPIGESVYIFPASSITTASGWKVYIDREAVPFVYTDTNRSPGFATAFHDVLHLGASAKWLKIHKPDSPSTANIVADYEARKAQVRKFYAQRFAEMFPARFKTQDYSTEMY